MARIIVCGIGGGGTKVTKVIENRKGELFADMDFFYMDTSKLANIEDDKFIKLTHTSKVYEVEGGGGIGKDVYEIIQDMGSKFTLPSADLYVLIYSGDRATGRIGGPELHKKLYDRGEAVLSIVLYDNSINYNYAVNNEKVFKTLKAYSAKKHFAVLPFKNLLSDKANSDEKVFKHVLSLSKLFSEYNIDIDPADVPKVFNLTKYGKDLGVDAPKGVYETQLLNNGDIGTNAPYVLIAQLGDKERDLPTHTVGKIGSLKDGCPFKDSPATLLMKNGRINHIIDSIVKQKEKLAFNFQDDDAEESDEPIL